MAVAKVSVKWGKETFSDVEVHLGETPLVFKSQLFALTGVPPDRQKVMIKGALLKDDDWGKAAPKDGATVMLMGSAEAKPIEPPKDAPLPQFVEDLPESQQQHLATKAYGSGLQNLGNTCYMNSVAQCLYAVKPLREALQQFKPAALADPTARLVAAARELFKDMEQGGESFAPYAFLLSLRARFPQFAQQTRGAYSQQDAEECWTNLLTSLREKVKDGDENVVQRLFGVETLLKLKNEESGEEVQESATNFVLKCNIDNTVNHLHDGIALGLKDDREKHSEALGRTVLFKGNSVITRLPPTLTVQLVRFFYKVDTQSKAKVLRKVTFPVELDVYEFCSPALKAALDGPRQAYKEVMDQEVEAQKTKKAKTNSGSAAGSSSNGAAATTSSAPAAAPMDTDAAPAGTSAGAMEVEGAAAGTSGRGDVGFVGQPTGKYELFGVLTHKGRSADSGHYTSWVKQADGSWILFDDDEMIPKKEEDILALSGGGDWHMAYLLLYRAINVPAPSADAQAAAAAKSAAAAQAADGAAEAKPPAA